MIKILNDIETDSYYMDISDDRCRITIYNKNEIKISPNSVYVFETLNVEYTEFAKLFSDGYCEYSDAQFEDGTHKVEFMVLTPPSGKENTTIPIYFWNLSDREVVIPPNLKIMRLYSTVISEFITKNDSRFDYTLQDNDNIIAFESIIAGNNVEVDTEVNIDKNVYLSFKVKDSSAINQINSTISLNEEDNDE